MSDQRTPPRRLRWGMVGGGRGAFIGEMHRMAGRLDDNYVLLAGALSADPERAMASARDCRIPADRAYAGFAAMAQAEAAREDGIEVVTIVTPNHLHHPIARAFLDVGIDVICDKPLATTLAEGRDLLAAAGRTGRFVGVTFNYTGYPMIRHARALVAEGAIGQVRSVQVEFALGWMSTLVEENDRSPQAAWRADPARSGPSGVVADIGTHAFNLAGFVTGLAVEELAADLVTFVPGRRLEDHASILLRYRGGARGMLWASMVAAGESVGFRLRVYGEAGHLAWDQSFPDQLQFRLQGAEPRVLQRGGVGSVEAGRATRLVAGLPEGYLEAFANLYRDYFERLTARRDNRPADPLSLQAPDIQDGLAALAFVEAVLDSHAQNGRWTPLPAL